VFSDGGKLSDLGRWYLGGLQKHLPELTLLGSPTPNAMKRRQPYSFCPLNDTWGIDNRTTALRAIQGEESAVRIEQRDGSAECNPYLVMAGQVAAGLKGIEERIEPSPRCEGDGYADESANLLPATIPDAIAALERSELAAEIFPELLLQTVIGSARYEHDWFVTRVSELERERYLDVF
jgi:glutamine synthetase